MKYTFLSGTDEQKAAWARAAHLLLNLPFDSMPYDITVEFDTGEVIDAAGHDALAVTYTNLGSTIATTKVRNDAPGFGSVRAAFVAEAEADGLIYNAALHFNETTIHELSHVIFAALPSERRLAILALFGIHDDDPEFLNPTDKPWADRPIEGIAESIKEAFLPRRFRVFANRTNIQLSYKDFPQLRSIVRGVGGGGGRFSYVYGSSDFRVDLSAYGLTKLPYHRSDRDGEAFVFYEEIAGYEECWGVDMSQFAESSHHPFSIGPAGITTS